MKQIKVDKIIDPMPASDGAGVKLKRSIGTPAINYFDPFLMLDEFGSENKDDYIGGFPAHPHRGIETVTYMLSGEFEHEDSTGAKGRMSSGDVQWMTTGSGLVHSELVTDKFKQSGGMMQGLQIWVNLPKKNKRVKPSYQHILKKNIPIIDTNDNIRIKVLVGKVKETQSIIQTYSPVSIFDIQFKKEGKTNLDIPIEQIAMVYVIEGELQFAEANQIATEGQMIFFDQSGSEIHLTSISSSGSYLVLAGKSLNEPIARHGPFVANTEGEIKQAMSDYQNGKMGQL